MVAVVGTSGAVGAVGVVGVTGVVESVYAIFGPFLIPGVVFVAGVVGYLLLVALGRAKLGGGTD